MSERRQETQIVITGAAGLIGFHLRARLHGEAAFVSTALDRDAFHRPGELEHAIAHADAVVHFAGLNRGEDEVIESTNLELAKRLVDVLEAQNRTPHLVFASSTHRDRDTAYGRSKRHCHEVFSRWSDEAAAPYTELVLPNVFGEHGKPHHNSAVSTFCHLLAHGETPELHVDQEIEWLHAQGAAAAAIEAIEERTADSNESRSIAVRGTPMRVSELLGHLEGFAALYGEGQVPAFASAFERDLFNTYRSYLPATTFPRKLQAHRDDRGHLVEAVKTGSGGQCFFSTTRPGVLRGGHYHRHKFERFLVVEGRALIRTRRLFDSHVVEYQVDGEQPSYVDMPTLHTHDLINVGDDLLLTLFWADEIFDPQAPDTFYEPVNEPVEGPSA